MRIFGAFVFTVLMAAGCFAAAGHAPAGSAPASPAPPPYLTQLGARDAGTDRAGNLWAWQDDEVQVFTPGGEVVAVLPVPESTAAIDADRQWGLAALGTGGRELRWARPGGEVARLPLADEVSDVAWVSSDEVAVSPVASRHRVEIWHLERRERVAAFGEATPVAVPEAGAYLLRSVLLEHDAERGRLWTLDSLTGDLQVFDGEGRPRARAQVDNPRRGELEAALRDSDAAARRAGRAAPARYVVLRLAVDEGGTGRVVTACSDDRRAAMLAELPPDGALGTRSVRLREACCTRVFTVAHDWLVLYDSPTVPGPGCTVVEPLFESKGEMR